MFQTKDSSRFVPRLAALIAIAVLALATSSRAAPPNDACGSATVIGNGTFTGSTATATNDGSASCGNSNTTPDVWYAYYSGRCSGTLRIDTCGSSFDTVLSVHSACPGTAANELACDDDCTTAGFPCTGGGTRQSCMTLAVVANTFYFIRVAGFLGATGNYVLHVQLAGAPPANDTCGPAIGIGEGTYTGSTCTATHDGAASCDTGNVSPDVWYAFQPSATTTLLLDTCGSDYDTMLSVHSGCPGTAANTLACNDDCPPGGPCGATAQSCLSLDVSSALTYYIRVAGFSNDSGHYVLNVKLTNNGCANETIISNGTYTGSTATATNDGSSSCGLTGTSPDVYFAYIISCPGTLLIDTCGSDYDTVISIHNNCPASPADELYCNDDCTDAGFTCTGSNRSCLSIPIIHGPYDLIPIRVSGYNGASGNFVLHTQFAGAIPANNACGAATAIGTGTFTGSTCTATNDGSTGCDYSSIGPDVWYSFLAPSSGILQADTCGSDYDTILSVHSGCPGTAANTLACNDDFGGGGPCFVAPYWASYVSLPVIGGNTYLIRVSGFSGIAGNYVLNVSLCAPPVNGDMNSNGATNGRDLQRFIDAILVGSTDAGNVCHGDFSGNGIVDLADVPGMTAKLLGP